MFRIFRIRILLIISGISLATAGIVGPTVFVDPLGQLNLFQLTEMMDGFKTWGFPSESTSMYFWIGIFFVGVILLSLIATLYRLYIGVWLLAVIGVAVWGMSYYYFYEWHTQALEIISQGGNFGSIVPTMIKTINLQWGAWSILSGMLLIAFATTQRKK